MLSELQAGFVFLSRLPSSLINKVYRNGFNNDVVSTKSTEKEKKPAPFGSLCPPAIRAHGEGKLPSCRAADELSGCRTRALRTFREKRSPGAQWTPYFRNPNSHGGLTEGITKCSGKARVPEEANAPGKRSLLTTQRFHSGNGGERGEAPLQVGDNPGEGPLLNRRRRALLGSARFRSTSGVRLKPSFVSSGPISGGTFTSSHGRLKMRELCGMKESAIARVTGWGWERTTKFCLHRDRARRAATLLMLGAPRRTAKVQREPTSEGWQSCPDPRPKAPIRLPKSLVTLRRVPPLGLAPRIFRPGKRKG